MSQLNNEIDALLDGTLDDLADMPTFKTPLPGTYMASIVSFEVRDVNGVKAPEIKLNFRELLEAADGVSETALAGQTLPIESSQLFTFFTKEGKVNEMGQGQFKETCGALKEATGCEKNSEIMAASKGMDVAVTIKTRADKNDKDKLYMTIVSIIPA